LFKEYKKGIFQQNASAYAFAKANETALEIATRFDIPYRKFLLFNDMVDGDKLIDNQYCFIQPKKSKYKGSEIYHQVKENETMYEISQFYGLKLQDLLDRNLLTEGQEPKNGEMILLNEKAFKAPTLRAVEKEVEIVKPVVQKQAEVVVKQDIKVTETKVEQKKLIAESSTYPESVYNSGQQLNTSIGNETEQVIPEFPTKFEYEPIKLEDERKKELPKVDTKKTELVSGEVKTEAKENTAKKAEIAKTENKFLMHIVQSNETLYSIGKKYGIEWEQIKKYNNLASNELSAKQSLKIPR
jgi:LysM repeat protein